MILDAHMHMEQTEFRGGSQYELLKSALLAGVSGGVVMSPDPLNNRDIPVRDRIDAVTRFCSGSENLFPFFWVDPMDDNAMEHVNLAAAEGVAGFKIICSGFYPSDNRVISLCKRAAELDKPVIFHSGILWDGRDSAKYNRPGEFECMLDVPGLRFSLAHISWPWCDECIAVYGKFANACAIRKDISSEMFIDTTPGTPRLWREDAMKKLLCGGYDVLNNILFGTDCNVNDYNWSWASGWIDYDSKLIGHFEIKNQEDLKRHMFCDNLLRFVGISKVKVERTLPRTAM